jgi:O-antigen/teichoic acid export membrane protein/glycosyltransferase involved in cell wall biosynthesis
MIAINAASQMMALGAILIVQTVYLIVVARVLGPEDFGRFSFAWSIVQILLIGGDLGLHNAAIRLLSGRLEESPRISKLFLGLKLAVTAVLLLVVLLLALLVQESRETRLCLVIFGLGMVFQSMSMGTNVVFQAHGKLYLASLNILLIFVVQAFLGFLALAAGGGVVSLAWAYCFAASATFLLNLVFYRRRIHPFRLGLDRSWRRFVRESLPVGLATLFQSVSSRIGISLLTALAGPAAAGLYSAALRFPHAMSNIPVGIFSALLPAMAAHQGRSRPVGRFFRSSLFLMAAVSVPLALSFTILARPLVMLLFGSEYVESGFLLQLLAWTIVPVFLGMAFSHVLLSQHELVRRLPWVTGVGLAVNLAANLILIPRMQGRGAALALLLSEATLCIGYALAALRFLGGREVSAESTLDSRASDADHGRIAVVVQRCGEGVIGGAELFARQMAEWLAEERRVEILTTCARDHRNWRNHFPPGVEETGGVTIRRFEVHGERHWWLFGKISGFLFALCRHLGTPRWIELFWLRLQGPYSPDLVEFVSRNRNRFDAFLFVTCLYYPTVRGLPQVADKSILIPTAHDEPAIRFGIYHRLFQLPRAFIFMSESERELVHRLFDNRHIPSVVAGAGVELTDVSDEDEGYLLCIGRIELGKGCAELFDFCRRAEVNLVVAGPSQVPIPDHVRYVGEVSGEEKDELLRRCRAVVVSSVNESLSIVALEGWARGKPVVARAPSPVADLVLECGGGGVYRSFDEFRRVVSRVDAKAGLRGRRMVRERYSSEAVARKCRQALQWVVG